MTGCLPSPTGRKTSARRTTPSSIAIGVSQSICMRSGDLSGTGIVGTTSRSDVAALDLLGERLHEFGNLRQVRVDGERPAKRFERELILAELLHDDAEAGERAEVTRLARQHLADVGDRFAVILVGEVE